MDKIEIMSRTKPKQLWGPLGIRVRIALLIVLITLGTFLVGWGVQYHGKHGFSVFGDSPKL